jgi:hypothetical protein
MSRQLNITRQLNKLFAGHDHPAQPYKGIWCALLPPKLCSKLSDEVDLATAAPINVLGRRLHQAGTGVHRLLRLAGLAMAAGNRQLTLQVPC